MGSHSFTSVCPKCNKETFSCCTETRSIKTSGECTNCGYYISSTEGFMTKKELNELQKELEVE